MEQLFKTGGLANRKANGFELCRVTFRKLKAVSMGPFRVHQLYIEQTSLTGSFSVVLVPYTREKRVKRLKQTHSGKSLRSVEPNRVNFVSQSTCKTE